MITCPVCSWSNDDHKSVCSNCGYTELGRYFYDEENSVIRACKSIWINQTLKLMETKDNYLDLFAEFTELQEEHDSLCDEYDSLQEMYDELMESYAGLEKEFQVLADAFAQKLINERKSKEDQTQKNSIPCFGANVEEPDARDFYMDGDTLREYRGTETVVIVPDYIKRIRHAFMNNEKINTVILHDDINDIGDRTFCRCSNLEMVILPTFIKKLHGGTFMSCKKLSSIGIPPFVEEIGGRAFERCESLISVEVPNSVRVISGYAFENCINLEHLYLPTSVEEIGVNAFRGCKKLTIHAPTGSFAEWYASRMGINYLSI